MADTDTIAATTSDDIKPIGPKPTWGEDISPEMQAVIEKLDSYKAAPIETLSATAARGN